MTEGTLVVTPAHDEEGSVGAVVERVRALGLRSLVVDDGSADNTALAAAAAGATVLRLPVNVGVGAALRTGFRYAVANGFKRVVQVDADLQHPPEAIPRLLEAADDGAELVVGSRFGSGYEPGGRRVAMRLLATLVSRRIGVRITDPTSGFKVVSEPLLSEFARSYPSEYLGDTVEALLQAGAFGASVVEVEVPMHQRVSGEPTTFPHAAGQFARVLLAIIAGKPGRTRR
ncbi:MAG: glycosyltransferase family 2 protein [Acidimicrobiia bacterium]